MLLHDYKYIVLHYYKSNLHYPYACIMLPRPRYANEPLRPIRYRSDAVLALLTPGAQYFLAIRRRDIATWARLRLSGRHASPANLLNSPKLTDGRRAPSAGVLPGRNR